MKFRPARNRGVGETRKIEYGHRRRHLRLQRNAALRTMWQITKAALDWADDFRQPASACFLRRADDF